MKMSISRRALPWLFALYCAASLLHFAHNAENLASYPNLPDWLTRLQIYLFWLCSVAVGIGGYLFYRRGHDLAGLLLLAAHAGFGFDGLLHYAVAPLAAHTAAMNLTIWSEAAAASLLLIAVVKLGVEHVCNFAR